MLLTPPLSFPLAPCSSIFTHMSTTKQTLDKWMDITIRDLHSSLAEREIGISGELDRSIHGTVSANEEGGKMHINYIYYGKFRDMGVRRGVSAADALGGRDKGWWNSVMRRRMMSLQEILINQYGAQAVASLQESLPGQVTLKM